MANAVKTSTVGKNEKDLREMAKRFGWDVGAQFFKEELKKARALDNPEPATPKESDSSPQDNLHIKREGKSLIITITDESKTFGLSKSGKSEIVASTQGFLDTGKGRLNLNYVQ